MAIQATPSNLEMNNAPLLDMLFNLLIFFIMACEFSQRENVKLTAPMVYKPQLVNIQAKNQLVFNLVPDIRHSNSDAVSAWSFQGKEYPCGDNAKINPALVNVFKESFKLGKQPQVMLRADQNAPYNQVYEAMGTITSAFIEAAEKSGFDPAKTDPRINLQVKQQRGE